MVKKILEKIKKSILYSTISIIVTIASFIGITYGIKKWWQEISTIFMFNLEISLFLLFIALLFLAGAFIIVRRNNKKKSINYKFVDINFEVPQRAPRKEVVRFNLTDSSPEYANSAVICGECRILYELKKAFPSYYQCPSCGNKYFMNDYERLEGQARSKLIKEIL